MRQLIQGGLILSQEFDRFVPKDILVADDRIERVVERETVGSDEVDAVIDAGGRLVIPGLINAHGHSYAGLLKGSIGEIPLDIYMLYAIAGGSARSTRAIYVSAMIDAVQMLKNGVTSFIDHFSQRPIQKPEGIDAVVQAFSDSGMRARVAPMYSDKPYAETVPFRESVRPRGKGGPPAQSPEEFMRVCDEAIGRWNKEGSRVGIMLGTDGPQRCTDELLKLTGELEEQHRCGWQTHVLEAKTQAVMSRRLYGKGLVEHMADDLGVLNDRVSMVHGVWLSEREIELTAEHGANVVHCPRSNLYLGSGVAPVLSYLDAGVPVALGTDGGNLGALDMFEVMRDGILIHRLGETDYERWPSPQSGLSMTYAGGAKAMQAGGNIGVLTAGAKADITILNTEASIWHPVKNLVRQMVYYENGNSVDTVLVDGNTLVKDGHVVDLDERALMEEAEEIAGELGLNTGSGSGPSDEEIARYRAMYLDAMDSGNQENED